MRRLFHDRHASSVAFEINHEVFALYKAVTAYINEFIPRQTGQRRSFTALARTVLQRRLANSACAIDESKKRWLRKQQRCKNSFPTLSRRKTTSTMRHATCWRMNTLQRSNSIYSVSVIASTADAVPR